MLCRTAVNNLQRSPTTNVHEVTVIEAKTALHASWCVIPVIEIVP